jgi:hypothetical protein
MHSSFSFGGFHVGTGAATMILQDPGIAAEPGEGGWIVIRIWISWRIVEAGVKISRRHPW